MLISTWAVAATTDAAGDLPQVVNASDAASDSAAVGQPAAPDEGKKTIKILGLGNSFLRNATQMLPGLVESAGHEMILCKAAPGGWTLERHHAAAMLNEANPEIPTGKPYTYNGKKMSLKDLLIAEKWDFVTIQQSSPNSFKIDTYRPHAQNLYDYIEKNAPDAEVVFHQTWAWREDNPRMQMNENPNAFMYEGLTRSYYTIAKEVGIARIIPVGNAFRLASESPEWTFERDPEFDYANPQYPNLPKEKNSLNGGFAWRNTATDKAEDKGTGPSKVFSLDGSHANSAGMYLGACVWFEFFFEDDVRKIKANPGFLGERASSLRDIAHKVVTEDVRPAAWPRDLKR